MASSRVNKHLQSRQECPACGSTSSETLYRASYTEAPIRDYLAAFYATTGKGVEFEYLEGSEYILESCRDCGLIYQKQVLSALLLRKLYEQWLDPRLVEESERRERKAHYYLWCAAETTRVIEHLGKLPSEVKFLDFGMGRGNWCLIAKGFGCDVYAMEISDAWREHADALGVTLLDWEDLSGHKFDFINAEQVFEHLTDPLPTLARLRGALSPNGILRINVPGGHDIRRALQAPDWLVPHGAPDYLNDVAPLQHLNYFNFEALVRMGQRAGLEEVEVSGELIQPEDFRARLKLLLRPVFMALFPAVHEARRQRGTNVCFRLPTPAAERRASAGRA